MTDRYVYLYRITLSKEGENPLYYFGIRFGFDGDPKDDDYMGSPHTHKNLWEDTSYIKSKDILKVGTFSNHNELRDFANAEIHLIKDAWDKYGSYSKGGRCLNAQAGRVFIHTPDIRKEIARKQSEYWTGNPLHPMKREEHRKRKSEEMKKFLKEHPERNPNNLPGVKEKQRKAMTQNNPMHRPEIRAKIAGENNPMYGKKHSEEKKKQISESVRMSHSNLEVKKKLSESSKRLWASKESRERILDARRKSNDKRIETLRKTNLEKKKSKQNQNSLENYFE
jgi:hypothetical protein